MESVKPMYKVVFETGEYYTSDYSSALNYYKTSLALGELVRMFVNNGDGNWIKVF